MSDDSDSTSSRSKTWLLLGGIFLLPLSVFLLTSLPGINRLTPFLALLMLGVLLVVRWVPQKSTTATTLLWAIFVLLLVGATGWFYSPFFFALYLIGIAIGFMYTSGAAVAFTLSLITMFFFSVGEVSVTYDFLTLLSLLTVIPITIALRRSFLIIQQQQKGILILEHEDNLGGITSLDAILRNKVNHIGTQLRQPLTYLKQGLALLETKALTEEEYPDVIKRMRTSVEELFVLEKQFERDSTNNELFRAVEPKTVKKP